MGGTGGAFHTVGFESGVATGTVSVGRVAS